MDQRELLSIVSRRFSARLKKDEVVLEVCVFCGNPNWNLELNADYGVFHCWACKTPGTLRSFLSEWCNFDTHIPVTYSGPGLSYEVPKDHYDLDLRPVEEVGSARQYLERRGVSLAEMMNLRIMFSTDEEYKNRIMLPAREYFSQKLFGYVGRAYIGGQKPKYMATFRSPMVAGLRRFQSGIHVVVEGLFDVMSVHRAGFNAAAVLGGAVGDVLLDGWGARIDPNHLVLVLLDGDAVDKAERMMWRLRGVHPRAEMFALPAGLDPAQLEARAIRALVDTVARGDNV